MAILKQIKELAHLSKILTTGRGVGSPFQAEQNAFTISNSKMEKKKATPLISTPMAKPLRFQIHLQLKNLNEAFGM